LLRKHVEITFYARGKSKFRFIGASSHAIDFLFLSSQFFMTPLPQDMPKDPTDQKNKDTNAIQASKDAIDTENTPTPTPKK
jgi:hypothetical protein